MIQCKFYTHPVGYDAVKEAYTAKAIYKASAAPSNLKSLSATSNWGGVRKPPKVFTEQGISMLSAVLHSPTAIDVSIRIMDAFVAMRRALISMAPVLSRVETVERRLIGLEDAQKQTSGNVATILDAMRDKKFPPQKVFFENAPKKRLRFAGGGAPKATAEPRTSARTNSTTAI